MERIWIAYFELIWHENVVDDLEETQQQEYKEVKDRLHDKYKRLAGESASFKMDMYEELYKEQPVLEYFETRKWFCCSPSQEL